jgi:hypothetical protein
MNVIRDTKPEEVRRIEKLLYGMNYEVWLDIYGPAPASLELSEVVRNLISKDCEICEAVVVSPPEAKAEIMDMILYEGGMGHGPENLEAKRLEIEELMQHVFSIIDMENAEKVIRFSSSKGLPAGVFWDFAFAVASKGKQWLFIGASSD